jgi:hypothetical protein
MESEAALVDLFVDLLRSGQSQWGQVGILQEFSYLRGRTDVVVTTETATIAFEAKLTNWRKALDQAYRNTCFAEQSYVLLPETSAKHAMRCSGEFEERGVGICCIIDHQISVLFTPDSKPPLEPWLTAHARGLAMA